VFALEVQFLTDAYRASSPWGGAEWPPHPERLYSALVLAWAESGKPDEERAALLWLERQPPPVIEADGLSDVATRDDPIVFVPPNGMSGATLTALPSSRKRAARQFEASLPAEPLVRFFWPTATPEPAVRMGLATLAGRVASLGHSGSLVRCAVVEAAPDPTRSWQPLNAAASSLDGIHRLRVMFEGRLDDLEAAYARGERPQPRVTVPYVPPGGQSADEPIASVFGDVNDWFIFEDVGGFCPDLVAYPRVAQVARNALLAYSPQQPAPEVLSGHGEGGNPSQRPHVAIVPLADLGWPHSAGRLLGLAFILPRHLQFDSRQVVLEAIARFARSSSTGDDLEGRLTFGRAGEWRLRRTAAPSRASLRPDRWCATSASWASALPVVLDRFPKSGDPTEEAEIIAAACTHVGLPEPVELELHAHAAVRGAPSAKQRAHTPAWADWSFPPGSWLAGRPRRHVVLRFDTPVCGPVILGAGRYQGLGLCLPMTQESRE